MADDSEDTIRDQKLRALDRILDRLEFYNESYQTLSGVINYLVGDDGPIDDSQFKANLLEHGLDAEAAYRELEKGLTTVALMYMGSIAEDDLTDPSDPPIADEDEQPEM